MKYDPAFSSDPMFIVLFGAITTDLMNLPCISNTLAVTSSLPAVNTCKLKLLVVGFGNTFTLIDSAGAITALDTGMLDGVVHVLPKLLNFVDLFAPVPQSDVYATLTLSPVAAPVYTVNLTTILCDVASPESITAFAPNVPTNDHNHPVAAGAVAVADGKLAAL
jgi:hypothetical protein